MPSPEIPVGPHDYSATLRQLKVLVVVLILSNIGLGLFAFYLLRSTDEQYSMLLGRTVPVLNELRQLTAELADSMRMSGLPLLNAPESQRPAIIAKTRALIAHERNLRSRLMLEAWPPGTRDDRPIIRKEGDEYDVICDRVVALAAAGKISEATELRQGALQTEFDGYVAALSTAATAIQGASMKANDDMTARTSNLSNVMLGLASWPVIVLIALLLLTAVFVVVLMVLFRGREMSDMP